MKVIGSYRLVLAVFSLFLPISPVAAQAQQAYKTSQINPPGSMGTFAVGLNNNGLVVGNFSNSTGGVVGFMNTSGQYQTFTAPKSNNFTRANGVNDFNTVVGDFFGTDGWYHGFEIIAGKFSQYDINLGHASTSIFGVNNAGNFVGSTGSGGANQGFINIGGTVTEFYGHGTYNTFAYGINNLNELVGQYIDSGNNSRGFYRDASGRITVITFPSARQTACLGINDSGEITGWYQDASLQYHGFIDVAGIFQTVPFLQVNAVNNSGSFVGYYIGPGAPGGMRYGYYAAPRTVKFPTLAVPTAQSTSIYAVNNSGVKAGFYTDSTSVTHGLMLAGSKVTNIDDPQAMPGTTICAGINSTGEIVGTYTTANNTAQAFLYAQGTFTDISPAGATNSYAYNITDTGEITGAYVDSSSVQHGFFYNGSTYTTIDVPGGTGALVWGINANGVMTVQWTDANGNGESSLYNGTTFSPTNVPGALDTNAHSINKSGNVVFTWFDYYGGEHGAMLNAGSYYVFDDASGTSTRANGINDSNLIVGCFLQSGSGSNFDSFFGTL